MGGMRVNQVIEEVMKNQKLLETSERSKMILFIGTNGFGQDGSTSIDYLNYIKEYWDMLIELIQIVPKEKLILIHTLPRGENKATRYTQMDIVGTLHDKARENRFASIMPFNALPNRHKMEARYLFGHSDLLQKKFITYSHYRISRNDLT